MAQTLLILEELSTEKWSYLKTEQSMKDIGFLELAYAKVRASRSGLMVLCMRAGGKITKLTAKAD